MITLILFKSVILESNRNSAALEVPGARCWSGIRLSQLNLLGADGQSQLMYCQWQTSRSLFSFFFFFHSGKRSSLVCTLGWIMLFQVQGLQNSYILCAGEACGAEKNPPLLQKDHLFWSLLCFGSSFRRADRLSGLETEQTTCLTPHLTWCQDGSCRKLMCGGF